MKSLNKKIYKIEGKAQNYDWGGKSFIPELINRSNKNNIPFAEYWLGTHSKGPSIINTEKGNITLDKFINLDPVENLGLETTSSFGKLPYLFKVLDVKKMLSIQVHPNKKAAEIGFKKENEKGILITAENRNFKDANHKPEIMVALSDFWLLHGFLEKNKLIKNLQETKELNFLLETFVEKGYSELYKTVMNFSQDETNIILKPLIDRILPKFSENKLDKLSPEYWAAKSIEIKNYKNLDKGIFSIFFFNILNLSKGQAIFQDAGVPHAYLEGQNIELMANSDNVLRGGLTKKHVDVEELLNHVSFQETIPKIIKGNLQKEGLEKVFEAPVTDFELSKIAISNTHKYNSNTKSIELLIVTNGQLKIKNSLSQNSLSFSKGESILIKANTEYEITTNTSSVIYKAKVGL